MTSLKKPNITSSHIWLWVSAVAFVLAYPISFGKDPYWIGMLSPLWMLLSLVGLMMYLDSKPQKAFIKLWAYYIITSLGVLYWIVISMRNYGNLSWSVSVGALLATCVFRALFPAVAMYLWHRYGTGRHAWMLGTVLMTLQDTLLHWIPFGGFPWVTAAYTLTPDVYWIQIADLVGLHGLNASVYLIGFLIYTHFHNPPSKLARCSFLWVLVVIHAYGVWAYHHYAHQPTSKTDKRIHIGWVQGNINQSLKWNPDEKQAILKKYKDLTNTLIPSQPDIVVWPEASVPVTHLHQKDTFDHVAQPNRTFPLLFGAPSYTRKDREKTFFNSAFVADAKGKISYRYDKMHLVPFGEFVPSLGFDVEKYFPAVAGSFSAGDTLTVAKFKHHTFGVSICYEVLFARMFRSLVTQGATFFINITNDAWFDLSSGPFQHLRFAKIRAIETRRPIVRVANTGISGVYRVNGTLEHTTDLFEEDVRVVSIQPQSHMTLYATFPYLVWIFLFVLMGTTVVQNKKRNP